MAKREVNYPHTIGFRLSDEAWFSIEQEVANTVLTPHDWCREVVLDRLHQEYGMSKNERILFEQFARTQYLVANGFQLLADDKLTSEEWKKFRAFAKDKIDVITDRALMDCRSRRNGEALTKAQLG
jgi:hypothetical protein